jgi:hypothetical protein
MSYSEYNHEIQKRNATHAHDNVYDCSTALAVTQYHAFRVNLMPKPRKIL